MFIQSFLPFFAATVGIGAGVLVSLVVLIVLSLIYDKIS